jgi:hypothetical protein
MALKSLVNGVKFDVALSSHNCQANEAHRVHKGDIRLKVRNGRGWNHYCRTCAQTIISRDIDKLTRLQASQPS